MSDPVSVFRDGSDSRKTMLKAAWPELFAVLGGEGPATPSSQSISMYCPSTAHLDLPPAERPPVVARLYPNAEMACRECVDRYSPRPGGYPLARTDPKDFT